MFSTKKPKDGWAGLVSGLKSTAKGTTAGIVSLVAQPIVGAKRNGIRGFASGTVTGVISAVTLPVMGLGVGVYQVSRGVFNSAEAARCSGQGMVWEEEKREWVPYLLDQEWEEVQKLEMEIEGRRSIAPDERQVKDLEYYDLLKVSTNATQGDIKKAYRKEARKCHPDKNPNQPEAVDKFQALGHAYQILSNEDLRKNYDIYGKPDKSVEQSLQQLDPHVFFAVMFGSDLVEPYVGELWIASTANTWMKDDPDDHQQDEAEVNTVNDERNVKPEEAEFQQRKREVKCAMNILNRISHFVAGTESQETFQQGCQEEAASIVKGAFGNMFCTAIGFALQAEAEEFLGFKTSFLGVRGHAARARKSFKSMNNTMHILNAGVKAVSQGQKMVKEAESTQLERQQGGDGADPFEGADLSEKVEQSLPTFLELAWAINVRDISKTLKAVCLKIFMDASVDPKDRLKRAEAIHLLGCEFYAVGKLGGGKGGVKDLKVEDIKAQTVVAAMTTMAKAQGQEVTEEDKAEMIKQAKKTKQSDEAN